MNADSNYLFSNYSMQENKIKNNKLILHSAFSSTCVAYVVHGLQSAHLDFVLPATRPMTATVNKAIDTLLHTDPLLCGSI